MTDTCSNTRPITIENTNGVVVTCPNDKMLNSTSNTRAITIENNKVAVVVSGQMGPPGPTLLSRMRDVNLETLEDGNVLVYESLRKQWIATKNLHSQDMDAGEF